MTRNSTPTAGYARMRTQRTPPRLIARISKTGAKGITRHLPSSPTTPHTMWSASQLSRKAELPTPFIKFRLRSVRRARCLTKGPRCAKQRVPISAGDSRTPTIAVLTSCAQAAIPPTRNRARRITLSTKTGSCACQSSWCRDARVRGP